MFMEFDKQRHSKSRNGKANANHLKALLAQKQEARRIFGQYTPSWQSLQTLFLEDLILS